MTTNNTLIYRLFWQCLHIICSLYDVLYGLYQLMRNLLIEANSFFMVKIIDVEYIRLHVKNLAKIPNHMTILLGSEEPSYADLAKMVKWCLAAGINYLSFYDITGVVKQNMASLQRQVDELQLRDKHVIWHLSPRQNGIKYENGLKGGKVHVKALCAADGRENIARVTRAMADTTPSDAITIETVNAELQKEYEFPDPELALYCSEVFTIAGYPPWQIRLTEFVRFTRQGSHVAFIDALYNYAKCEQRKGQ